MDRIEKQISGPYGILITPFLENGGVDYNGLLNNVEALCQTSIMGIIPGGSTSEFISLSFEENENILSEVASTVSGRKKLIGGATSGDVHTSIRYITHMARIGYEGALVAPPYYFRHGDEEVEQFFREISCDGFPIIAYNIPNFTNPISLKAFEKLLGMDHIAAMKNSSANMKELMQQISIRDELRPDFQMLIGVDDAIVISTVAGCDGSFLAMGSIMPKTVCKIYEALSEQDINKALIYQKQIVSLLRLADSLPFPIGYKLLAKANGFNAGHFRQSISQEMRIEMELIFEHMEQLLEHTEERRICG